MKLKVSSLGTDLRLGKCPLGFYTAHVLVFTNQSPLYWFERLEPMQRLPKFPPHRFVSSRINPTFD
jgi:hypothetical protein